MAKGVYALPEGPADLTVARANGGVLSRESAALHHGFEVVNRPLLPHVTIRREQRQRHTELACNLHTTGVRLFDGSAPVDSSLEADSAVLRAPLAFGEANRPGPMAWLGKATSPLGTVLDCAMHLLFGEALAIADSAVRTGKVRPEALKEGAAALRGAGRRAAIRVVEAADGRSASALESMLRARVIEAGIGGFVPQYRISGQSFAARVDLGNPLLRIAIEADSFAFHGTRGALRRDCRRYVNLAMCGWLLLRYSWEDVMLDEGWVGESLAAVVEPRHPGTQNPRRKAG